MTSYRPMFTFADGTRVDDSRRFATHREARDSAAAWFLEWTTTVNYSVDESNDPVNYRRVDGSDQPVSP